MHRFSDIKQYILNSGSEICSYAISKCIISLAYVIYSFLFDPTKAEAHIAIMVLIVVDFVTGLASAKMTGETITSGKIFHTAIKIIVYFTFIASASVTETAVPTVSAFCDETIIAFLAFTELISVTENIGKMGFAVPKKWLNKLQELRDNE